MLKPTFSFNSHWGYCEECKGLGSKPTFSIDLAIKDSTKPLFDGALDTALHNMFSTHGKHYTDSLFRLLKRNGITKKDLYQIPFNELDKKVIDTIFFGGDYAIGNVITEWHSNNDVTSEDYSEWKDKSLGKFFVDEECNSCHGERLNEVMRAYTIQDKNISQVCAMTVEGAINFFDELPKLLTERENTISKEAVKEINTRLSFLDKVGLNYLSLGRKYATLSGGEAQRIRLASQLGSKLTGADLLADVPVGTEFTVQIWCAVWGSDSKSLTVSYGGSSEQTNVGVSISSPNEVTYSVDHFTASTDFTFTKVSNGELTLAPVGRLLIDKIIVTYEGGTEPNDYMDVSVGKLSFTANMGTYSAAQNVTLTLSGVEASTVSYAVDNEDFIVTPVNETEYSVVYKASPVKGSYNGTLTFNSTQDGVAPVTEHRFISYPASIA